MVDGDANSINNRGCMATTNLHSPLRETSEPTNNILDILSTSNNSANFHANNNVSLQTPLASSRHNQLRTSQALDRVELESRSGNSILHSQPPNLGEGGNSIRYISSENHAQPNSPSPSHRVENSKVGPLENGGNDHSPKYISL